jgi:hypothetical protein
VTWHFPVQSKMVYASRDVSSSSSSLKYIVSCDTMYLPAQFLSNQFAILQFSDLDIWDGKYNHWLAQQWAGFSEWVSQPRKRNL